MADSSRFAFSVKTKSLFFNGFRKFRAVISVKAVYFSFFSPGALRIFAMSQ